MRKYIEAYRAITPRWGRKDLVVEPIAMAVFVTFMLIVKPFGISNSLITLMTGMITAMLLSYARNGNSLNGIAGSSSMPLSLIRSSAKGGELVKNMVVADLLVTAVFAVFETGLLITACELFGGMYVNAYGFFGIAAAVFGQFCTVIVSHMSTRRWAAEPGKQVAVMLPMMYLFLIPMIGIILLDYLVSLNEADAPSFLYDCFGPVNVIAFVIGAAAAVLVAVLAVRQATKGYMRGFADSQEQKKSGAGEART